MAIYNNTTVGACDFVASSYVRDTGFYAMQNLEISQGRTRVISTVENLEEVLKDRKEAYAQAVAAGNIELAQKLQVVIKNLEGTLNKSPIYQQILKQRSVKTR